MLVMQNLLVQLSFLISASRTAAPALDEETTTLEFARVLTQVASHTKYFRGLMRRA